jgi:phosphatidylglycerol:prolipoprotein diacylglycerol transferase
MQFPVYFWVGPLAIHPHPIFECLAYLAGARLYGFIKARDGDSLPEGTRWWVVAAAFVGAALGSKLLVLVDHPALTLEGLAAPLALLEGKTIVGALLGALIGVELTKRRLRGQPRNR